jgi:acetylornithine/succinyldiaminopimelate/putrescine aminotransferase
MPESFLPSILVEPPGPNSILLSDQMKASSAPMGPKAAHAPGAHSLVLTRASGSNVFCADNNRYVDLAAGFGAMLVGHGHPRVLEAVGEQSARLLQALGDVYPSDRKVRLLEALSKLHPSGHGQVILGQSGADAITGALKTALLKTGRPNVVAFSGSYHGLSYAPLSVTDLRASYRDPFASQLSSRTSFFPFPRTRDEAERVLEEVTPQLDAAGAVIFEPIQGRAGVWPAPPDFLAALCERARARGALSIADEVWTGLGRSGQWLFSTSAGATPDLICLGKGLGGGVPISACIGSPEVMRAWSREHEVVHTSTFAGAPLACATAEATLEVLKSEELVARACSVGGDFVRELESVLGPYPGIFVRGRGLMVGIDVADFPGEGRGLQRALLQKGYITTTGGGARNVLVLTPPLNIPESLLAGFVQALADTLGEAS